MKKRILSLTLVLCMILTLFPASVFAYGTTPEAGDPVCSDPIYSDPVYTDPVTSDPATTDPTVVASGTCGENLTWVLDNSGTLTISGTGNMMNYDEEDDEYYAPWSIYREKISNVVINEGVTSIGNWAFAEYSNLTNVTIPDSVISIGDSAIFNCNSFTSVTIPDSVTRIGHAAFAWCVNLSEINVAEDNECYCSIDGVLFNEEITELIQYPSAKSGEFYVVPDGVTRIGDNAFWNCYRLTSVAIPNGVTRIGDHAFGRCSSLASMDIPAGVTSIGEYAFGRCSSLTSITIPNSVTRIGDEAFDGCTELKSVTIPDSVTRIGDSAFAYCKSLTCMTIPNSVTTIGENAFYYCSSVTNVTIPDSVTGIGDGAFGRCSSLTSITIPNSVTRIGDEAFDGCTELKSVTIPDSVTRIGDYAFSDCYNLTSVTFHDSVTSIGYGVFQDCYNLADAYYSGSEEEWNAINIGGDNDCLTNAAIHYNVSDIDSHYIATEVVEPTCTEDGYTVYTCPCGYSYEICAAATGHNFVDGECTECSMREGYACIGETRVDIPENETVYLRFIPEESGYYSVTSICDKDTYGYLYDGEMNLITENDDGGENNNFLICRYLEAGKTYCIGVRTYSGNASSADVCISKATTEGTCGAEGDNLTWTLDSNGTLTISGTGNMMNYYGDSDTPWYDSREEIRNVVITEGVTSIGDFAFCDCYGLTSITIPDSVTNIGGYAFDRCTNLFEINVSENNEYYCSVDGVLFNKEKTELIKYPCCKSDESYTIPYSVTSIGSSAFAYCCDLTSLDIPDSVTSIGDRAFAHCSSLTSITIPDSVTSIGDYMFYDCNSLTSITIPDSVTSIVYATIGGCRSLASITIPDSVTSIGDWAFSVCDNLADVYYKGNKEDWRVINIGDGNENLTNANMHFADEPIHIHDYTATVTTPSCTEQGYTTHACECGARYVDTYVASLGHNFVDGECTRCGVRVKYACIGETRVDIPENETIYLRFIPEENGLYSFTTLSDEDTYGYLYDGEMNLITENDDGGEKNNFLICRYLEAGKTYCIGVRTYSGNASSADVCISKATTEGTCGAEGDNLTWTLDSNGTLTISGTGNMMNYDEEDEYFAPGSIYREKISNVVINEGVTSIGDYAFFNCSNLTNVDIPDSVTSIGYGVFQDCSNLADAYYSGSEEEWNAINIGGDNDCLTNAAIHYNVSDIDSHYIATEVVEPTCTEDGYTVYTCPCGYSYEICAAATGHNFVDGECTECGMREGYACIGKTRVNIPENETIYLRFIPEESGYYSVTSICDKDTYGYLYDGEMNLITKNDDGGENNNFLICRYLEAGKTYCIGVRTYSGNASSADVCISKATIEGTCGAEGDNLTWTLDSNGTLTISGTGNMMNYDEEDEYFAPWSIYREIISNVVITEGVTSIGIRAFWCCYNLTSVDIPDSVISIEELAFFSCQGLTSVTIPDSVTSIGYESFTRCDSLSEINVSENNEHYCSVDGVLFNKEKTELIKYPFAKSGGYIVPDSVTVIGGYAFAYCFSLTSITIPNSVTVIGDFAFRNCSNLTSVDIPDSVTSIGDYAFEYCSSLTSITIPDSVTSIGNYAFSGCNNLADVYYSGSEEEWNAINIGEENECLTNATIHFAGEPICDHNYTATVTDPSCTEQGYTTYTCTICGHSYIADYVAALKHNFVNGECTECGATAPVAREGFIVVSDERARAGEEVTVSVSVEENPGIMVMVLGFDYDKSKLELIGYEDGLMSGWKVASNAVWIGGDSVYEDGVILKLKFKVLDDVEDGEVKVSVLFAEGDIANHDEQIIMPEKLDGGITVYTNIPGDITGDDIVNALDLVRLQRYLTGEAVAVAASCDVNGDGLINAQDLVRLQRYLSGENIVIY